MQVEFREIPLAGEILRSEAYPGRAPQQQRIREIPPFAGQMGVFQQPVPYLTPSYIPD
jgi:hypothetical protein